MAAGNEQQLLATCRQLNAEIVSNVAKVQTALQLSEEDQATIVALKRELEKSWKSLDASIEKVACNERKKHHHQHAQEVDLKEQIAQLKSEVSSLSQLVDGAATPPEVTEALDSTTRQRDALLADRDAQAAALQALRDEAAGLQERLRSAQAQRADAEAANAALQEELAARKAEGERCAMCWV